MLEILENIHMLINFHDSGVYFSFNFALIFAAANLKEPVVAPFSVPGVGTQPIRYAAVNSPANNLDGVFADELVGLCLIDS